MVNLSFTLPVPSSPWRRTWEAAAGQGDPSAIPETDLRYKYFAVNAELTVSDVEIISKTRFVTLVDLALSVRGVVERLSNGEDASLGFTESAEVIRFRGSGATVSITSSKSTNRAAATTRTDLLAELGRFLHAAHSRLVEEIPALSDNPVIRRLA